MYLSFLHSIIFFISYICIIYFPLTFISKCSTAITANIRPDVNPGVLFVELGVAGGAAIAVPVTGVVVTATIGAADVITTSCSENLRLRHKSPPISRKKQIYIWGVVMSVNPDGVSELRNVWVKTAEQQLFHELEVEYGFPRATCRSLVQLMHEFIDQNYGNLRDDSQVIYHAVSKDEPPGRQLDKIKTIPVRLTVSHSDDAEVLEKKGIQGLRQHKLIRFASEAYDQGGLLVQEDLALLLTSSRRTIQRDMKELRNQGIDIPTRGSIQDIGPTISHKTKIVELYLKGYEYTEIERRTRHTGHAIKRYIVGFSKVIMLHKKGFTSNQIRELTNNTEKVVGEYLELYQRYMDISNERLEQILSTPRIEIETNEIKKGGIS